LSIELRTKSWSWASVTLLAARADRVRAERLKLTSSG
jgi:hypothetical protein